MTARSLRAGCVVALVSLSALGSDGGAAPPVAPAAFDLPRGEVMLRSFLTALSLPDEEAAAKAVVPFVHKSLLEKDGASLSAEVRRFSFKKAHGRAKEYALPLLISRTRQSGESGVGFRESAESGAVVDYFLERRRGQTGLPAPVKVFFPSGGGEPKVLYMGSL